MSELVDLRTSQERARELGRRSVRWPSWTLSRRQLCDLELLGCGGFSPLKGFLGEADYRSVCESMRLADGTLWPIPVVLDIDAATQRAVGARGWLALRDPEGTLVAVLRVEHAWRPDLAAEAVAVFGTTDVAHPGVAHLRRQTREWYVSGALEVLELPQHHGFRAHRHTPDELRAEFAARGWDRVVAFQTRNPMHRAHQQLTLRAMRDADATLLIHPIVGIGKPGDIDVATRLRCYRALLPTYPPGSAVLSLLPLAMRMAGPREAVWHALIRRNYGATHFIVGRDHAGPGLRPDGRPFYDPYAGHRLLHAHVGELGLRILTYPRMIYVPGQDRYLPEDQVPAGEEALAISGTELRRRLATGVDLPEWFTPPEVAAELRRSFPPRDEQGFTVFFTGLSGAGKSSIARELEALLTERHGRPVTLLDGDVARTHLSGELGYSRADRDRNIARLGYVAAEITKHRGIAICAAIAPFDTARRRVREAVSATGGFVLAFVDAPLPWCESRDRKGLYAKARAGVIEQFTGISDPYEPPLDADLVIDPAAESAAGAAQRVLDHLYALGYLRDPGPGSDNGDVLGRIR
ncbi:bifunctional sulfate adenylyltransferase/adenylylsulfate kinase [Amycolatopsis thermophila]|uniref:Sulfate adenylyltransferase n=1 Tax=Amycolatopsis thermophila TaxID=206084 RepID=A0ABU0F1U3_9PSEU|nr:bifunctional sulfate adenylyltransferase/adenylylsulfate kinase [Amycolatopsis thermophila]MDQ0381537.1 sulfate adenylyltransferase [Amycolatopsis thermophila]